MSTQAVRPTIDEQIEQASKLSVLREKRVNARRVMLIAVDALDAAEKAYIEAAIECADAQREATSNEEVEANEQRHSN
jgi:hypothetical protein